MRNNTKLLQTWKWNHSTILEWIWWYTAWMQRRKTRRRKYGVRKEGRSRVDADLFNLHAFSACFAIYKIYERLGSSLSSFFACGDWKDPKRRRERKEKCKLSSFLLKRYCLITWDGELQWITSEMRARNGFLNRAGSAQTAWEPMLRCWAYELSISDFGFGELEIFERIPGMREYYTATKCNECVLPSDRQQNHN